MRYVRVVVRIGDYKQDSFFQGGQGVVELLGVDDDEAAIRHELWLATDRAYKSAAEALTAKKAALKQLTIEYPVDDFAKSEPVKLVEPLVKLDPGSAAWPKVLQDVTAYYRQDPQLESCDATFSAEATNRYFVNSEGAVLRTGRAVYGVVAAGSTQAADGMRLERSSDFVEGEFKDLPTPEKFKQHAEDMMATLRKLREAPVVDEEYRGPVLFDGDAATHVVADLIGDNVLGRKPQLGKPARTSGAFAASYMSKVLPDFLSVQDDPTVSTWQSKPLLGHYEVDDDGVKAAKVSLIDKGKLIAYDLGREPIRDFPASNGHGRAQYPMNPPGASLGNLIVQSSEALSDDALKAKLIELCKQRDLAYCYRVKTTGPRNSPRLLYKVFSDSGLEQLVRGATFGDLDTRTMRNDIVAAGEKAAIENRPTAIPHSIVSPALLFDELEVKRVDQNKEKLPEYPAPELGK
jgi:predicted Zn-dependent protease